MQASVDKLQVRVKELLMEVEKLRQDNEKVKSKNESLILQNKDLEPFKKQVNSLRSENLQLQKSSAASLQQLNQVEKTQEFYKKSFEEADQLVKKFQAEKERGFVEKMESITSENAKLREELDRFREAYDRKLLQLAATGSPRTNEVKVN